MDSRTPARSFSVDPPAEETATTPESFVSNKQSVTCSQCKKTFGSKIALQRHAMVHTGERPYACGHCRATFRCSSHLKRHERLHTGERPYACAKCTKCYPDSTSLLRHREAVHDLLPYPCGHCDMAFSLERELRQHLEQKHDMFLLPANGRARTLCENIRKRRKNGGEEGEIDESARLSDSNVSPQPQTTPVSYHSNPNSLSGTPLPKEDPYSVSSSPGPSATQRDSMPLAANSTQHATIRLSPAVAMPKATTPFLMLREPMYGHRLESAASPGDQSAPQSVSTTPVSTTPSHQSVMQMYAPPQYAPWGAPNCQWQMQMVYPQHMPPQACSPSMQAWPYPQYVHYVPNPPPGPWGRPEDRMPLHY